MRTETGDSQKTVLVLLGIERVTAVERKKMRYHYTVLREVYLNVQLAVIISRIRRSNNQNYLPKGHTTNLDRSALCSSGFNCIAVKTIENAPYLFQVIGELCPEFPVPHP
jgi:hypothetical protein